MSRGARLLEAAAVSAIAASAGAVIPALRLLVAGRFGQGGGAGGVFVASHVAGVAVGTALVHRWLRRHPAGGSVPLRRVVAGALLASAALIAIVPSLASFGVVLAVRFADGAAHAAAVMTLLGLGANGAGRERAVRATRLGALLVLGVGAGLGLGGAAARAGLVPPFLAGAGLALVGAVLAALALPSRVDTAGEPCAGDGAGDAIGRAPWRAAALVAAERFTIGTLTVTAPFAVSSSRAGAILGLFPVASIVAMPLARRLAERLGPDRVARCAAVLLALALGAHASPLVVDRLPAALAWAALAGAAAGGVYAAALVSVARDASAAARVRGMGLVHAAGSLGYAAGALAAGAAMSLAVLDAPLGWVTLLGVPALTVSLATARPTAGRIGASRCCSTCPRCSSSGSRSTASSTRSVTDGRAGSCCS